MKVLITHQFNSAMERLDKLSQIEVSQLYSFILSSDKEHVIASSFTQILSANNDIFTLRGNFVRIFCTFNTEDQEEVIVFLDVQKVMETSPAYISSDLEGEVTLFGHRGEPVAYIDAEDENTIYSFSGEPMAYIDEENNIYGFNGKHLGWFQENIVWDHEGNRVGFTQEACPSFTQFEPFKGFKQFKPFKGFKQFAPFKPIMGYGNSNLGLLEFLKGGRN